MKILKNLKNFDNAIGTDFIGRMISLWCDSEHIRNSCSGKNGKETKHGLNSGVYLEPSYTSRLERFEKVVNGFQLLKAFLKSFMKYVWQGSKCPSGI